jgi:putative hydrolase of the HAD superfamily
MTHSQEPSGAERKIDTVLFDLDGTLLDRDSTLQLFCSEQYDRFEAELSHVGKPAYIETLVELDDHGYIPKTEAYPRAQDKLRLDGTLGDQLLQDFEENFHDMAIPFPGMHEALTSLSAMGLRMGLVTNGRIRSQRPKIAALKIGGYFQAILISEEQGVRKPDPEIYRRALQALGSDAQSSVFIGDHPVADIEGPARLGMRTIWKRNTCWPAPNRMDAAIDDMREIVPIIARINSCR